jgi:eukaryotic-like serine/threonine-protein kinase
MGAVYEVEHVHTGEHLALKVLLAQAIMAEGAVARFKREARLSSRIKSEHIVRVTDADVAQELGGAPFFVMDLLEGADLDHATSGPPAPQSEVVSWLRQVARGLGKAHDLGIVHRDLKPANLFLTRRDDGSALVKILDFGIAKTVAEASVNTQSGQLLGTPMFMAPEQILTMEAPITPRADLYALGLIAFKLLVGRDYWNAGRLPQIIAQVMHDPMAPPSARGAALGADFDAWFLRACSRAPADRFSSAEEQVEALAAALGADAASTTSTPVAKPALPPVEPQVASASLPSAPSGLSTDAMTTASLSAAPRSLRRRPAHYRLWIGAAVGLVVLLGATASLWYRKSPSAPVGSTQPVRAVDPPAATTAAPNAPPAPEASETPEVHVATRNTPALDARGVATRSASPRPAPSSPPAVFSRPAASLAPSVGAPAADWKDRRR